MTRAEVAQRIAKTEREKAQADYHSAQLAYRLRVLPEQLERARARVAMLEREAAEYGMRELLA